MMRRHGPGTGSVCVAFKLLVMVLLVVVLMALFTALYALSKGGADGAQRTRVVRLLTWRIGLSVLLFLMLPIARLLGWI
jgi:hypothetical protein